MPFLNPTTVTVKRQGQQVIAANPFWSVVHDLSLGGAPVDIRFVHGCEGNLLRGPLDVRLDGLRQSHCKTTRFHHSRKADRVDLVFEGQLARPGGGPSNVRFRASYTYTPYAIRREVSLRLPENRKARRLTPLALSVDDRFTYYSAAQDPHTHSTPCDSILGPGYNAPIVPIPSQRGGFFRDSWPPGWVTLCRAGGEALQITPCGDLSVWDAPDGSSGQGQFTLVRSPAGIAVTLSALAGRTARPLPRNLTFACSIGLVNLPATHRAPLRTAMIGNPPFPDDAMLELWARSGTELLIIMEGTKWVGGREESAAGKGYWRSETDRFWRMGARVPYADPSDMADLARLVKSVHRLGMKIVPYTAPAEINPELPAFAPHIRRWRQQVVPGAGTTYHSTGNYPGAIYGGLVCPGCRGVQEYYLSFAKSYVRKHGFDGIYVDLASKVFCHNATHGPAHHGGIDGLWRILGDMRTFLGPGRLIIAHNGDCNMLVTLSNLADNVVTMEAINSQNAVQWDLPTIHPYIRSFPACPNQMIPNYSWYWTRSPQSPAAMRDGIAKGVLLGSMPFHLDIYFDPDRWGYKYARNMVADEHQIFGLFRRLKTLDLRGMRFDDVMSGAVKTDRKGVLGARYTGESRGVIVLSNLTRRPQRNVRWRCAGKTGMVKTIDASDYCFIEVSGRGVSGRGWT